MGRYSLMGFIFSFTSDDLLAIVPIAAASSAASSSAELNAGGWSRSNLFFECGDGFLPKVPQLPKQILVGEKLLLALAATVVTVKLLRDGTSRKISSAKAAGLVRSGLYVGSGRTDRVFWIRMIAESKNDLRKFPNDYHYWDERAVLRFWAEQRSMKGKACAGVTA